MRVLLVAFVALLLGCGSTRIVSEDPNAEIFLNDHPIGIGEARVNRVGPPKRAILEARRGGETVGTQKMHRHFSFMTVVWGVCSYYTGFYWGWYYPEFVKIPVQRIAKTSRAKVLSLWNKPGESVWMQPVK